MPLLLCRKQAKQPYFYEKLNLRIWSEQELCYLIVRYPLLTLDELPNTDLIRWIGRELLMPKLAERLLQAQKAGESRENQLLLILQSCNYYDASEIAVYRQRVMELRRYSRSDYLREEAAALFEAGRMNLARDSFLRAADALDEAERKEKNQDLREALMRKKANLYLDMAVVSMRLFEEQRALNEIAASELFAKTKRATRMRFLITGTGSLPDAEQDALQKRRRDAEETAKKSAAYRALVSVFDTDSVRRKAETAARIAVWKKEYRRML